VRPGLRRYDATTPVVAFDGEALPVALAGIVLCATVLVACDSDPDGGGDSGGNGTLKSLDLSAAGVRDLCRHRMDAAVQAVIPTSFTFASAQPGAGDGTNCYWEGPSTQQLVAEFFKFPFTDVDDNGKKVRIERESFERDHQAGYTARPDLAGKLGGTGAYVRHLSDFHTVLVFSKDRAVFITTIGPVALSDFQLQTLALSLRD
jgi:hypothetical protein